MSKAGIIIFLVLLISTTTPAQNLVRNGSFESFTECPVYDGRLHLATGWYNPNSASPDLFHACSNDQGARVGVPAHTGGYQPARTGDGYAAIILYGWADKDKKQSYREYMGTKLSQPMKKGQAYCVSLYASLHSMSVFATNGPSIYFGKDSLYQHHREALYKISPQLTNTGNSYLEDTTGWSKLSWVYIAEDNFEWMAIGNFANNNNTPVKYLKDSTEMNTPISYYYIDDVSVSPMPTDTDLVKDVILPCGLPVTVSAKEFETYKWSTGTATQTITIANPGKYWVEAVNGCVAFTDTFTAVIADTSTQNFKVQDAIISCREPVKLSLPAYDSYLWSTGETSSSISIRNQGIFWATVSNRCGTYTDTFTIADGGCVFIPGIFSPNSDGQNDIFRPRGIINHNGYAFTVFNRWGQQVFYTTDINVGWNGMHGASMVDIGTYYWQLTYREIAGKDVEKQGSVIVIR